MDENLIQTQESPQSLSPLEKKSDKTTNLIIVVLLLLIFVVLGVLIGYQMLFKKGDAGTGTESSTGQTTVQTETSGGTGTTTTGTQTTTADQTTGQTSGQTGTTQTVKADIDGDLKTLDSLDLSGIENEYGEDSLGDL
jgi:flagellar basal body-associated protein FliL